MLVIFIGKANQVFVYPLNALIAYGNFCARLPKYSATALALPNRRLAKKDKKTPDVGLHRTFL
jgi:hypothetical protein